VVGKRVFEGMRRSEPIDTDLSKTPNTELKRKNTLTRGQLEFRKGKAIIGRISYFRVKEFNKKKNCRHRSQTMERKSGNVYLSGKRI
jgi:hypothetical protein